MGAKERIVRVTEQIASCDTSDKGESMEEIMQLERVTVAAGQLSVVPVTNAPVVCAMPAHAAVLDFDDRISSSTSTSAVCSV